MATLGVLLLDGCHFPTRNADTLQSIRNEARVLIARSKKYG